MKLTWPRALPLLAGRAWWPFAAIWSLLLAICLWSSAMVLPDVWQRIAEPVSPSAAVGLTTYKLSGFSTILAATPAAAGAGLHRGDRILLIDGKLAVVGTHALDRQLAGRAGTQVSLVTKSLSGATGVHVVTRDSRPYRESLAAVGLTPVLFRLLSDGISYIFDELLLLGCAVVLMLRRSHDPLAPWASLMMLALLLGNSSAGKWFCDQFADPTVASYVANSLGFSLLLIVLSVFPTGQFEPRWSLPLALIGVVCTIVSEPWPAAVSNILLILMQVAAVAAIAARYRRLPPGSSRQQIRWALLGFAASVVALLALTLSEFAELATYDIGVGAWLRIADTIFGLAVDGLLIVCLTVSLLRWRLYDADVTISRSIVYGGLTLGLLAIFAGSEKVIEILGEQYFGERLGALAGGLGAAVAAVCIGPLHHRVSHWTEKRFRGGLLRLRKGLPSLVGDLRETATPAVLADTMLERVEQGVRARHGAVVVDGQALDVRDIDPAEVMTWIAGQPLSTSPDAGLRCDRTDPLFPMQVPLRSDGWGLVGWLLLGPRPDGSFYGRDEREALQAVADPVARALAIAIERDSRITEQRERENELRREVSVLQQHMDTLRSLVLARHGPDAQQLECPS